MRKNVFIVLGLLSLVTFVALIFRSETNAVTITYCQDPGPSDPDEYDPDQRIDETCGSTPSSLKRFLQVAGYKDAATAGIMGSLKVASCGYNPRVYNNSCSSIAPEDFIAFENGHKTFSGGFGLAQWDSDSRVKGLQKHADEVIQESVTSLNSQISYLVKELKSSTYKMYPSKLNGMRMEEVVWLIMRDYETPSSVTCTSASDPDCTNEESARDISLTTLLSETTKYASAYKGYSDRLNAARESQSISTASCTSDDGEDDDDDDDDPPVGPGPSGALGKQSASGFYSQCRASYSDSSWRINDQGTICGSGCSLIAVANAAKYLGATPNDPGTLASWTRSHISYSQTGWNGSVAETIKYISGLKNWSQGNYLWQSYNTSTATKISKIRGVLGAGGVVIAGGDRNRPENPYREGGSECAAPSSGAVSCTDGHNINSGRCVFSRCGHFIAIIGITSDDKLIIANPANGRNGTAATDRLNADIVLKLSNKAIGVYKR